MQRSRRKLPSVFTPPLPPLPPIDLVPLQKLLVRASQALGRLDGISDVLLEINFCFITTSKKKPCFLRKSKERNHHYLTYYFMKTMGRHRFLSKMSPRCPPTAALEHGLKRLREGFPLSLRLIREMHEILLSKGRGSNKQPGVFRTSQNWIGGTRPGNAFFVVPSAEPFVTGMPRSIREIFALGGSPLFVVDRRWTGACTI